VKVEMEKEN